MTGTLAKTVKITDNSTINISNLKNGMYTIKVKTEKDILTGTISIMR